MFLLPISPSLHSLSVPYTVFSLHSWLHSPFSSFGFGLHSRWVDEQSQDFVTFPLSPFLQHTIFPLFPSTRPHKRHPTLQVSSLVPFLHFEVCRFPRLLLVSTMFDVPLSLVFLGLAMVSGSLLCYDWCLRVSLHYLWHSRVLWQLCTPFSHPPAM